MRFQEFDGEWLESKFEDVCTISTGNKNTQDKSDGGVYPFYVRSSTVEHINAYTFDGEAILTAGDGVGVGKIFHYTTGKIGVHQRVYILSNFTQAYGKFIFYYFSSRFYDRVKKLSAKNSVDSVRYDMIAKMRFCHALSIAEQLKIATLLSKIDMRIQTQSKIIQRLETLINELRERLFAKKLKFKDDNGNDFSAWKSEKLAVVTFKVDKKNKQRENLPIYSVSNVNGFVPQSEQFDNIDSNDRGYDISLYKIVEAQTFVYNPARINVGSIAYSGDLKRAIVSSLYVCVKTVPSLDDNFFKHFLQTEYFKNEVLKKGEGGVRIYLFYENFAQITISLPYYAEQIRIANFLFSLTKKINLEKMALEKYCIQKKHLLSNMFI